MDDLSTKKKSAGPIPSEKEMESWFGMLDDASKAEVMKAKIAADADVQKAEYASTEFQQGVVISKIARWAAIVLCCAMSTCASTCVADKWQQVAVERIHYEHPDLSKACPTAVAPLAAPLTPVPTMGK